VSVNDDNIYYPNDYKLTNYPNPFNPNTTIEFLIKEDSNVSISIFNTKGQVVKNLVNKFYTNGNHSIEWNGVDENNNQVSSGIYYYSLCINGNTKVVKKCILLK
jgi:flagellar hook assembly protein FlgD